MSKIKVGLNGFGRIGRAVTRIAEGNDLFEIVHINTRKTSNKSLAYLLKYDSIYRTFDKDVRATEDGIEVNGRTITTSLSTDPALIPWVNAEVQVVIDATGAFVTKPKLSKHLRDTVQKVILTAPAKDDETFHVVLGVNELDRNQQVISNASCTTNCAAPLFHVLHTHFKIMRGYLTTAHAYTKTQSLLDDNAKSPGRGRAAAINIIPSTTGAAKAVGKIIPELQGKINGIALRVPVPTGSFVDITAVVEKETTPEEINTIFKKESEGAMQGILGYATDVIVSSDIIGSTYSSIFDSNYTDVIDGTFVKIYGWYDNEWGYSSRIVNLIEQLQLA